MPAREGNSNVTASLPSVMVEQLDVLAAKPGQTRSKVIEEAIRRMFEGSASETLLDGLHQRTDALQATVETLTQALKAVEQRVTDLTHAVEHHLVVMTKADAQDLQNAAYDKERGYIPYTPAAKAAPAQRGLARLFGLGGV